MTDGRSQRIDDLVAEYLDRLNSGETLDPFAILTAHPEVGAEVVDKLETFVDLATKTPEAPPVRILGDFTLRRQIGRGGMGAVVYEAWENSMDRRVALKVLPAAVAADDRTSQRFLREAKTAGKLSHPNVVPVFTTGVKDQTPYYAMEYVEGETLAEVLARLRGANGEAPGPERVRRISSITKLLRVDDSQPRCERRLNCVHQRPIYSGVRSGVFVVFVRAVCRFDKREVDIQQRRCCGLHGGGSHNRPHEIGEEGQAAFRRVVDGERYRTNAVGESM